MNPEEDYRNKIDVHLSAHFEIDREVWSTEKKRIDYVLKCKKSGALFGLEVKANKIRRGREYGKYLKQASDYSKQTWQHKFGAPSKLLIFISPAFSSHFFQIDKEYKPLKNGYFNYYKPFHDIDSSHQNLNSLIGELCNLGEVKTFKHYYNGSTINYFALLFRNKFIWSSLNTTHAQAGLHEANFKFYHCKLVNNEL
jgi:hypothetical protein